MTDTPTPQEDQHYNGCSTAGRLYVPNTGAGRALVELLEQAITDDPTASESACCDYDPEALHPSVFGACFTVTYSYDGIHNMRYVQQIVEEIEAHTQAIVNGSPRGPTPPNRYELQNRQRERRARETRERLGVELTPRQQQAREARRNIDWESSLIWTTPHGIFEIRNMTDPFLWNTVIWLVRNQVRLFSIDQPEATNGTHAAALWLRGRTAFRALVREAIRRNFTFPDDVFLYCKMYLLDANHTLDGYQPWHDPDREWQAQTLQPLQNMPDVPIEVQHNKDLRSINL